MNDPVFLSRLQFAITAGFHFLFPPISIGLAWLLVVLEGLSWKTGREDYAQASAFFAKIFGLTFGVGVVSGIVLEFQFGMNWAGYATFVGDIFGSLLAAEALFAFFLESVFMGFYLFGRKRVSPPLLWLSILLVAIGASISAFWIIAANSWQQTPAGHIIRNGRAELVDFWAAVLNFSTVFRFHHTLSAAIVTGAFFMIGCAAFLLIRRSHDRMAQAALRVAVPVGLLAAVVTAFPTGHQHARQVARTQPEKLAAIEGIYETQQAAPLVAFGLVQNGPPPQLLARVDLPIKGLLSWMAYGDFNAEVKGLDSFVPEDRPPLWITFVSFHNMVIIGGFLIFVLSVAALLLWRGTLASRTSFLRLLFFASPLPLIANEFGWVTAEVGRQPWIVYHVMRTRDAVSQNLTSVDVWISLTAFTLVYLLLLSLYLYTVRHLLCKQAGQAEV